MASLPPGRALAAAAGAGAPRARGPGRGRGLLRRAGRRALRAAGRAAPPGAGRARPGPARSGVRARRPRRSAGCATRARADATIAEALLDQRALAGIGNVYKNETLFIERVDPFAAVGERRRRDARPARRRPPAGCSSRTPAGGTGPERVTTGARPLGRLWVYGRAGRPCRRCGTLIRSAPRPRSCRDDVLVPALPGGGAMTERESTAAHRHGLELRRHVARGGRRPSHRHGPGPDLDRLDPAPPTRPTSSRSFAFLLERESRSRSCARST